MKDIQTNKQFDTIIIGGGAAGLSAALWCDDLGLNALLVEADAELGGQLLSVYNSIENHLGTTAENGKQMRDLFVRQIEKRKFTLKLTSEIKEIDFNKKSVLLESDEVFSARAIVIATGVRRRTLNVPGEKEFKGKGIIESGRRDEKFFTEKTVIVVGGGDAAFENALILAKTAKSVTLVHRAKSFRARSEFIEQVLSNPNIKVLTEFAVREISGSANVESVKLENLLMKEPLHLPIDALLVRIGVDANTKITQGKIDLDGSGYIKIDGCCETNIKNIFAVGDVANPVSPTVSTAVGSGATAIKAIYSRLSS